MDVVFAASGAGAVVYGLSMIYVPAAWIAAGLATLLLVLPARSNGGQS